MKFMVATLALLAGAASAQLYDNTLASEGVKCALINLVVDESGSMLTEHNFLSNVAVPEMVTRLEGAGYDYDHVFICNHGFGNDPLIPLVDPNGYRFIGCSDGLDPALLSWNADESGRAEDSYMALDRAMDEIPASIDTIPISTTCKTLDKNMILVTDEDRDESGTPESLAITKEDIIAKMTSLGYLLNVVGMVTIGNAAENNIGMTYPYYRRDIVPDFSLGFPRLIDVPNEVFAPKLNGDWEQNTAPYISSSLYTGLLGDLQGNSAGDYGPLIEGTRGAIWSIQTLRNGNDAGFEYLAAAFANAFVDVKADEISCEVPPCRDSELGDDADGDDENDDDPDGDGGGVGGDPHIITWKKEHYEYHGQCDLVMVKDPEFADGLGLDIHIRTKLVRYWSYIKTAAIRIGEDILEIEGSADADDDQAHYWINFEYQGELDTFAGFPVTQELPSTYKRSYTIDLDSKYPGAKIIVQIYKEFVRVKFSSSEMAFGKTEGLLGNYVTGATYARDGVTVLDDFTELGQEWQVLPADGNLFREISHPQFPEKCVEPEDPRGERRRRLDESSITIEQAEAACGVLKDPLDVKDCVYDVLATQDIDMIGAF